MWFYFYIKYKLIYPTFLIQDHFFGNIYTLVSSLKDQYIHPYISPDGELISSNPTWESGFFSPYFTYLVIHCNITYNTYVQYMYFYNYRVRYFFKDLISFLFEYFFLVFYIGQHLSSLLYIFITLYDR
jgi:hypothetical protein